MGFDGWIDCTGISYQYCRLDRLKSKLNPEPQSAATLAQTPQPVARPISNADH
jgi:hypothetical protein